MIYIGRMNRMKVVKHVDFGVYLDGQDEGEILLPRKDVPHDTQVGDRLHVFIYRDSDDRLIATTKRPLVQVGEAAYLKVKQQNNVGTFMDWGLPKDLLVPFNEQAWPMNEGRNVVIYCYLDENTNRIAGTTKFHRHLSEDGRNVFQEGDAVKGMVAAQTELGYKIILNNTHIGLLYKNEVFKPMRFGHELKVFIKQIREDGRIDLSIAASNQDVRDELEEKIMAYLKAHDGVSHITDKSPPNVIYDTFNASKANFKRALGRLYKKRLVSLDKTQVRLLSKTSD
ncbi:MAG: S1 RNA-binding domain-containing protein [Sedimenticolaceae bacterium]|jgi:predicted RNA-binding protein (virulence factor B family)